jgi:hypothetical protein
VIETQEEAENELDETLNELNFRLRIRTEESSEGVGVEPRKADSSIALFLWKVRVKVRVAYWLERT